MRREAGSTLQGEGRTAQRLHVPWRLRDPSSMLEVLSQETLLKILAHSRLAIQWPRAQIQSLGETSPFLKVGWTQVVMTELTVTSSDCHWRRLLPKGERKENRVVSRSQEPRGPDSGAHPGTRSRGFEIHSSRERDPGLGGGTELCPG